MPNFLITIDCVGAANAFRRSSALEAVALALELRDQEMPKVCVEDSDGERFSPHEFQ
jgi:hypothetical protein